MSGHSKWNNIKRKKEKTDGAKAKDYMPLRQLAEAIGLVRQHAAQWLSLIHI